MRPQGDNDPVDVVEIGSHPHQTGGVYKIKPLGVYAMIVGGDGKHCRPAVPPLPAISLFRVSVGWEIKESRKYARDREWIACSLAH